MQVPGKRLFPDLDDTVPRARYYEALRGLTEGHVWYNIMVTLGGRVGSTTRYILITRTSGLTVSLLYNLCTIDKATPATTNKYMYNLLEQ